MAIFKRGKLETTSSDTSSTASPTMTPDAVADAEAKVQDLLGQSSGTGSGSSVLDGVSPPAGGPINPPSGASSIGPPVSTLNVSSSPSTSTLEVHEEGKPDSSPTSEPAISTVSLGARKFADPDKIKAKPLNTALDSSSSDDGQDDEDKSGSSEVVADVDREVNDLIGKLENEATKLDSDITSKEEKIKELQSEIDAHKSRKSEIDTKIGGLKQVVEPTSK